MDDLNGLMSLLSQKELRKDEQEKAREEERDIREAEQKKKDADQDAQIALIAQLLGAMATRNQPTELHTPVTRPTTPGQIRVNQEALEMILDIPELDIQDMRQIEAEASKMDPDQRAQAEDIVKTQQFKGWVISPTSSKLLVHGNFSGLPIYSSALSLFCISLTTHIRDRERFYSLVFFCGLHLHQSENSEESHVGGRAMIKSLIAQLLRQYEFNTRSMPGGILPLTEINELCALFGWLVGQLPPNITLVCFIDGIEYYERDEYLQEMEEVLAYVLELIIESKIAVDFKVMVTSPGRTRIVRQPFEIRNDGNEILSLVPGSDKWGDIE
ncbi:hypothetical protein F5Y10DRAFT_264043 [Nemania abortiva]|nr:hypothetical protein F5Y10DRAFT_264043 [Nemania abortiva]